MSCKKISDNVKNQLDFIKCHSVLVADSGDYKSFEKFNVQDATTNPSLILKASKQTEYSHYFTKSVEYAKSITDNIDQQEILASRKLYVLFGKEILKVVKGRVSTEVNPEFSYDVKKTVNEVLELARLYKEEGISTDRILFKICTTWEGAQAAKILEEKHNLHINMTLIFSKYQAIAAAQAGATLVSPFVGRIYDYYKSKVSNYSKTGIDDDGVKSVTEIYHYFKKHDYSTLVMGASFRNVSQILSLSGCDLLTISPQLMQELTDMKFDNKEVHLRKEGFKNLEIEPVEITRENFDKFVYQEEMAGFKLNEGITKFGQDHKALCQEIRKILEKLYIERNK